MAVFSASSTVDDVAAKFPLCAQSCVTNGLLQKCAQVQTMECFCTTQPVMTLMNLYYCVLQDASCSVPDVINKAIQLCSDAGYDTSQFESALPNYFPTGTVPTISVSGLSSSVPGGNTSIPSGSTSGSESGSGSGGNSKSSQLSTSAVIGLAVTGVVALGILAGLIIFIVKNRRVRKPAVPPPYKQQLPPEQTAPPPEYPAYIHILRPGHTDPPQGYPPYELPPDQLHELGLVQDRHELSVAT